MRRRWFIATLRRINLPEPVILTRLAIALCVLSFCFMILLSVSGGVTALTCNNNEILHFYLFEHMAHDRREAVYVGRSEDPISIPQMLYQRCRETFFQSLTHPSDRVPRLPTQYSILRQDVQ